MAVKEIKEMTKKAVVEKFQKSPADTGSAEVQIAVLSRRIAKLTDHFKAYPKDNNSKRGLMRVIGQRKRLLNYILRKSPERYTKLTKELGIR